MPGVAHVSREQAIRVDIEFGERPRLEQGDRVFVIRIEGGKVLPGVDDVPLLARAGSLAKHDRPFVRPGLEPLRHEAELDAREVHARGFLAHAGAVATSYLKTEARTRPPLEA